MSWQQEPQGAAVMVGPEHVSGLVESGALLVDVREPEEWSAGHAPDAHHVPLGDLEARVHELPRDRLLVMVCRSGQRSALATHALRSVGFDAVNLDGGMQAWAAAGFPVHGPNGGFGTVA